MVNINISIPDDLHKRLRIKAAQEDTTQKELVIAFLQIYSKQHGKH